jgi:hypothetical protein
MIRYVHPLNRWSDLGACHFLDSTPLSPRCLAHE